MKYVGRREVLSSWVKSMLLESVASTVDISHEEIDRLGCIDPFLLRKA